MISTKAAFRGGEAVIHHGLSRHHILAAAEGKSCGNWELMSNIDVISLTRWIRTRQLKRPRKPSTAS